MHQVQQEGKQYTDKRKFGELVLRETHRDRFVVSGTYILRKSKYVPGCIKLQAT